MSESPAKVICRFSCGAASAVATKIALRSYPDALIIYNDTRSEHPDNVRFRRDCERWFGREILVKSSDKYKDTWDVWERKRFLVSPDGAPCTGELKRIPGEEIWNYGDVEVFGFTAEEAARLERWKRNNEERKISAPLIDLNLTKSDCLAILDRAGIELPTLYKLGFRNNNCIPCVKARDSVDYWKRIRKHFPQEFRRMAKLERELGYNLNRVSVKGEKVDIYLDEIEPGDPIGRDPDIQCGLFCQSEIEEIADCA